MLLTTSYLNSSTTFAFKKTKAIFRKANKHRQTYLSSFNATYHFKVPKYLSFPPTQWHTRLNHRSGGKPEPAPRRPGRSRAGVSALERSSRRPPAAAPGRKTLREKPARWHRPPTPHSAGGQKGRCGGPLPGGLGAAQGLPLRLTCACGGG